MRQRLDDVLCAGLSEAFTEEELDTLHEFLEEHDSDPRLVEPMLEEQAMPEEQPCESSENLGRPAVPLGLGTGADLDSLVSERQRQVSLHRPSTLPSPFLSLPTFRRGSSAAPATASSLQQSTGAAEAQRRERQLRWASQLVHLRQLQRSASMVIPQAGSGHVVPWGSSSLQLRAVPSLDGQGLQQSSLPLPAQGAWATTSLGGIGASGSSGQALTQSLPACGSVGDLLAMLAQRAALADPKQQVPPLPAQLRAEVSDGSDLSSKSFGSTPAAALLAPHPKRARVAAAEADRAPRCQKCAVDAGTLLLLEHQNRALSRKLERLEHTMRLWCSQGFVTPDQALEFLGMAPVRQGTVKP